MKVLVINAGSSSLKYQLFDMDDGSVLAKGLCERIGLAGSKVTHKKTGDTPYKAEAPMSNHEAALQLVLDLLTDTDHGVIADISEIGAVGHRIAHGGEKCRQSMRIDDEVVKYLYEIVPINPLHGPPAIAGIEGCRKLMPNIPHVGVFDTSFYANMKDYAYIYPIPYEYYEKDGIRRYGFHGTSHRYVTARVAELMGKPLDELKIVTCHLGNGSSITATMNGVAVDTSMGFTPQGGIEMGTRSGDIDPTIAPYLMRKYNLSPDEIEDILNRKSGLLGVYGQSPDSRDVMNAMAEGDYRATLANNILVHGIKKYIGSYVAEMNGIDALVFTAGIGENDAKLREMICENLEYLGIVMDTEYNASLPRGSEANLSAKDARVQTWVIPTDEEYMIALDTLKLSQQ